MSMTGKDLHTLSGVGTVVVSAMIGVALWWVDSKADDEDVKALDPYADMEVIDAALAFKAPDTVVQPQKQFRQPPPVQPTKIASDPNTTPVTKPDDPRPDPGVDIDRVLNKNRDDDDDLPVGPATQPVVGAFDGSEDGWGDETRGDPYLGALKSELLRAWEYPEILSEVGTPIGCIHLEPDGTVPEVVLREKSGNAELDDSVERALAELQKKREKEPKPVPAHLIPKTRKWICYRMKVS
jgi:hypothetical protein